MTLSHKSVDRIMRKAGTLLNMLSMQDVKLSEAKMLSWQHWEEEVVDFPFLQQIWSGQGTMISYYVFRNVETSQKKWFPLLKFGILFPILVDGNVKYFRASL